MEIEAGLTSELPAGGMKAVQNGGKSILVANVNGTYYAIGNMCTHQACSLSEGILKGERVECPCHGSTFNVKDGKVVKGPAAKPEPSFKVRTEGEKILVTVENRVYA